MSEFFYDSIGDWGDSGNVGNGLAYVGNNPINATDPFGLGQPEGGSGDLGRVELTPGHVVGEKSRDTDLSEKLEQNASAGDPGATVVKVVAVAATTVCGGALLYRGAWLAAARLPSIYDIVVSFLYGTVTEGGTIAGGIATAGVSAGGRVARGVTGKRLFGAASDAVRNDCGQWSLVRFFRNRGKKMSLEDVKKLVGREGLTHFADLVLAIFDTLGKESQVRHGLSRSAVRKLIKKLVGQGRTNSFIIGGSKGGAQVGHFVSGRRIGKHIRLTDLQGRSCANDFFKEFDEFVIIFVPGKPK